MVAYVRKSHLRTERILYCTAREHLELSRVQGAPNLQRDIAVPTNDTVDERKSTYNQTNCIEVVVINIMDLAKDALTHRRPTFARVGRELIVR